MASLAMHALLPAFLVQLLLRDYFRSNSLWNNLATYTIGSLGFLILRSIGPTLGAVDLGLKAATGKVPRKEKTKC